MDGQIHALLADLVAHGGALGWVEPPTRDEIDALLATLRREMQVGDADVQILTTAEGSAGAVIGFAYWRRYARPTHRPHADIERIAVARTHQGQGIGRQLTEALIASARAAGIEQLTLDVRGDNVAAIRLYRSWGFTQYGVLPEFVAVGERRFDKLFFVLDLRTRTA